VQYAAVVRALVRASSRLLFADVNFNITQQPLKCVCCAEANEACSDDDDFHARVPVMPVALDEGSLLRIRCEVPGPNYSFIPTTLRFAARRTGQGNARALQRLPSRQYERLLRSILAEGTNSMTDAAARVQRVAEVLFGRASNGMATRLNELDRYDSMGHVQLMLDLETEFGVTIEPDDFVADNTLQEVAEIVDKKSR
jgi:acyl carrier protein